MHHFQHKARRSHQNFLAKHKCDLLTRFEDRLPVPAPFAPFCKKLNFRIKLWFIASQCHSKTHVYFRSQYSLVKENLRQIKYYTYTVHPFSRISAIRSVIVCFLWQIVFLGCSTKYSFMPKLAFESDPTTYWPVISFITNTLLFCDMLFCFNLGYTNGREIVLDRRKIIRRYLQTYFIFDLIPTIYELIIYFVEIYPLNRIYYFLPWPWLRLVRYKDMIQFVGEIMESNGIREDVIRCFKIVMCAFYFIHWSTCIIFYIVVLNYHKTKFVNNSYIMAMILGTDRTLISVYIELFLYVTCHFFGTNHILIGKENHLEYVILCLITIFGMVYKIVSTALCLQLFTTMNMSENKFDELIYQIQRHLDLKHVSKSTKERVYNFFHYKYQRHYFHEKDILNSLSEHLRHEVTLYSCRKLIDRVTFFQDLSYSVVGTALGMFKREIYLPTDVIVRNESYYDRIYFIASGTVAAYARSGKEIMHLEDGNHFGEVSFLLNPKHKYVSNVVAIEITTVYYIEKDDLMHLFKIYPDVAKKMRTTAWFRLSIYRDLSNMALVDNQTGILNDLRRKKILKWPTEAF